MAHPGGRPTKYKPQYCKQIIEFMKDGHFLDEWCASIGIAKRTLYLWKNEHEEFMRAVEVAQQNCVSWWLNDLRESAKRPAGSQDTKLSLYLMNNVLKMTEVKKIELTGANGMPLTIVTGEMTDEQLATILATSNSSGEGITVTPSGS